MGRDPAVHPRSHVLLSHRRADLCRRLGSSQQLHQHGSVLLHELFQHSHTLRHAGFAYRQRADIPVWRRGNLLGAPSSDTYSATGSRGLLFFSAHANTYNNTLIGAGATLNFSGALYFHNSSYADLVQLNGAGGSTTYAVGNIVVDQLTLSGSGTIAMDLVGSTTSSAPEVSIFQ